MELQGIICYTVHLFGVGEAEQLRLSVLDGSSWSVDLEGVSDDLETLASCSGDGVGQRLSQVGTNPIRLFSGIRYNRKGRISGDTVDKKHTY